MISPEDLALLERALPTMSDEEMVRHLDNIDLSKVVELDDNTELKESLACGSQGCEIK